MPLLLRHNPSPYAAWLSEVKDLAYEEFGDDYREALAIDFLVDFYEDGNTPEEAVERIARGYFRVRRNAMLRRA